MKREIAAWFLWMLADDRHGLGRRDVVAMIPVLFTRDADEVLLNDLFPSRKPVATTHTISFSCPVERQLDMWKQFTVNTQRWLLGQQRDTMQNDLKRRDAAWVRQSSVVGVTRRWKSAMWWMPTSPDTSSKTGLRENPNRTSGWASSWQSIKSFRSQLSAARSVGTWNRTQSRKARMVPLVSGRSSSQRQI